MTSKSKQLKRLWSLALLLMLMCLPGMAWAQWTLKEVKYGTCYNDQNTVISLNGLNNTSWGDYSIQTSENLSSPACQGTIFKGSVYPHNNSKFIAISVYEHSETVPAYTKLSRKSTFKMVMATNRYNHGASLYVFDNLDAATTTALDAMPGQDEASQVNCSNRILKATDDNGNHSWTEASRTITYDNSESKTEATITKYIVLVHVNTTGNDYNTTLRGDQEWAGFMEADIQDTHQYKVILTYQPNGGEGSSFTDNRAATNSSITLNKGYTRGGYHQKGWNTKADGTGTAYTDRITPGEDTKGPITLYAQWEEHAYTQDCNYGGGGLKQCSCGDVTGTYKIGSLSDLLAFNDLVSARTTDGKYHPNINAELTADIEFDAATTMLPIGCNKENQFTYTEYQGTFDGKGHTIKDMRIQKAKAGNQSVYLSLFYGLKGATVKNLTLTGVDFTESLASHVVGVLAPDASNCTISNVYIEGNAASSNFESKFGGMIGSAINTNFENCGTNLAIKMDGNSERTSAGGLCCRAENTTFTNCFFAGKFTDLTYDKVSQSKYRCTAPFATYTTDVITDNCYAIEWQGSGAANNYTLNIPDMLYTKADFASGKIAYLLNGGKTDGTQAWYQKISNEGDGTPLLTKTGSNAVFANHELFCDGDSILSTTYSNTAGNVVRPHEMLNYICQQCGEEPESIENAVIEDATLYNKTKDATVTGLTYRRSFVDNDFNCLYVPFDADIEAFTNCEIYAINMFQEHDSEGEDGVLDELTLEVVKATSGKVLANHPYLIRYKGNLYGQMLSFNIGATTLKAADTNDYVCSSMNTDYYFAGTYSAIPAERISSGCYTMVYDSEQQAVTLGEPTNGIKAQRWYMAFESRDPQIEDTQAQEVKVNVIFNGKKSVMRRGRAEKRLRVTANYQINVYSSDNALGSVSGTGWYDQGSYVTVTATPTDGHKFQKWNDGNTKSSFKYEVQGGATWTAYFGHVLEPFELGGKCKGCNYFEYEAPVKNNNRYEISTRGQLMWFSQNAKNYANATFVLTADIDMSGLEYDAPFYATSSTGLSINTDRVSEPGFRGTFDGQGHTISNLKAKATNGHMSAGLVGNNSGTIRHLRLENFEYDNEGAFDGRFGAICGVNFGTIENCAVVNSTVKAAYKIVGAIAGANHGGRIVDSYAKGCTLEAHERIGYLVGDNRNSASLKGTVTNCYADKALQGTMVGASCTGEGSVTDARFKSGEICYLLNHSETGSSILWFQTVQTDEAPHFHKTNVNTVYQNGSTYANCNSAFVITANSENNAYGTVTGGGDYTYSTNATLTATPTERHTFSRWSDGNTDNPRTVTVTQNATYTAIFAHTFADYVNGFAHCEGEDCSSVIIKQPATLNGDHYEIGNAGQLLDFVEKVNDGQNSINATLTADIDMQGISFVQIAPSANLPYMGTIDGQYHTIRNLSINATTECGASFIGYSKGATIQNLTLHGTYTTSAKFAAGFVGRNTDALCEISNCISAVTIKSTLKGDGTHGGFVGVATAAVNLSYCGFVGAITTTNGTTNCAGLIGWDSTKGSLASNCYVVDSPILKNLMIRNSGNDFSTCYYANSGSSAQGNRVNTKTVESGELCYKMNKEKTDGTQKWYQRIGTDAYPILVKTDNNTVYYGYATSNDYNMTYNNLSGIRVAGALSAYTITDGSAYSIEKPTPIRDLTYKRTFSDHGLNCLYVPFDADITKFTDCSIYTINMFQEHDADKDGVLDELVLEINKVTRGKILPNHPYLIKYNGSKLNQELTFSIGNATLSIAETPAYDCSSMNTNYIFRGTYTDIDAATATAGNYYTMVYDSQAGYCLGKATQGVGAQRWYMTREALASQFGIVADPVEVKSIRINTGDDDETSIENLTPALSQGEGVGKYLENGRIVIYKNGKKYNTSGQVLR